MSILKSASKRSMALAGLARKLVGSEILGFVGRKDKLLLRLKQAQHLVDSLSSLKGTAMKMGQLFALEAREFLPAEVVTILEQLQNQATFMDQEQILSILKNELKDNFHFLKEISPVPIAAASIGQVHTAIFNGKKVAIKIQYPGITDTIDADIKIFKNLATALSAISGKSAVDYNDLFTEITQTIKNETHYLEEARITKMFKNLTSELPAVRVPEIYDELTTDCVLTMSYEIGKTLSGALNANELTAIQKESYGKLFLEIYTRELCQWGLVQTDPNLGNFLIDADKNELVLLDFGATRTFDEQFRKDYAKLIISGLNKDRESLLNQCLEIKIIDPREDEAARNAFLDLIIRSMDPFRLPHFDFANSTYAQDMRLLGIELVKKIKYSPPPKNLIFLHRKLGGIFQILRRLDVKLDLRPYIEPHKQILRGDRFKL